MLMMRAPALLRLYRMDPGRRRRLLRAWAVLTVASAAVAILPFRVAIKYGAIPLGRPRETSAANFVDVVESAARRMPWRTMCIEKGIAVQRLLRGAGLDARLHYGARHATDNRALEAHVWVSLAGTIVLGGEEAADFAEIATFP